MVKGAQTLAQLDVKATIAQCSIDYPVGCTLVALVDFLVIVTTPLVAQQRQCTTNQCMPGTQVT